MLEMILGATIMLIGVVIGYSFSLAGQKKSESKGD